MTCQIISGWVADCVERLGHDPENTKRLATVVERFMRDSSIDNPADITAKTVVAWLGSMASQRSRCTIRNYMVALRSISSFMHSCEWTDTDRLASIRVARADSAGGCDAITDKQADQLVALARAELQSPSWQKRENAHARLAAYVLMLDCGLRRGELRHQLWSDIDLDDMVLTVTRDKARRRDRVTLTKRAAACLRLLRLRQRGSGGRVFPCGPNAKKVRADLDRIGCSGEAGSFHRLRKWAITSRARSGMGVWHLTAWARHRDPKTTLRYVTLRSSDFFV